MTTDMRREAHNVFKQFDRYHDTVGETIVWFKFDVDTSTYDEVYDEGFRRYLRGILVPVLWIDQVEDTETYAAEGRRPTQRLLTAVSARVIDEVGLNAHEAHGGRAWDPEIDGKPWMNDRENDIVYYDGRYYAVSNFQIRGRGQLDLIIGVSAIETQVDERLFDFPIGAG